MRARTAVTCVIFLVVLSSAGYHLATAWSAYMETARLVDRVVSEATSKGKAAADAQMPDARGQFVHNVRAGLLEASKRPGIPWTERDLVVSQTPEGFRVTVTWTYPLLSYGEQALLPVPMSVDRSFTARL